MMLNLTRTAGQSILIYPDDIPADMTVAELFADGPIVIKAKWFSDSGHQVALGVRAPGGLKVMRDELISEDRAV